MHKRYRSLLFVPASRGDLVQKSLNCGADAVILDLEDGVAPADKQSARENIVGMVELLLGRNMPTLVRVNPMAEGGEHDLLQLAKGPITPLLLPKVTQSDQIDEVIRRWISAKRSQAELALLPMIESPAGMYGAHSLVQSHNCISGLVFGSEDFATTAGLDTTHEALKTPAQMVALAAACRGLPTYGIPGSLANYHECAQFEESAKIARVIGFAGALCIHPSQVKIANEVFSPTPKEIEWAKAVIEQYVGAGRSVVI